MDPLTFHKEGTQLHMEKELLERKLARLMQIHQDNQFNMPQEPARLTRCPVCNQILPSLKPSATAATMAPLFT